MRWLLNIDGGPKRVNHAAVAIGDKIFTFGGYSSEDPPQGQVDFIDVHMLNTFTLRWEAVPTVEEGGPKKGRSATMTAGTLPSTSRGRARRSHSLPNGQHPHPLALIRAANPPLDDDSDAEDTSLPSKYAPAVPTQNNAAAVRPNMLRELMSDVMDSLLASVREDDSDYSSSDGEDESAADWEDEDGLDLVRMAKLRKYPNIPVKRYGHTVVAYRGRAYLWGGRNDKLHCNEALYCFDPDQKCWSVVRARGECPPVRDGHTAVVHGDSMFVFGGFEEREHRFSQETFAFHFPSRQWTKVGTAGEQPPRYRDFHAAAVLDGKMYVFGGRSDETGQILSGEDLYCEQLHFLDLRTQQWHEVQETGGTQRPSARRSHTMWAYNGALFLFGGYHSIRNVHFNDLWRFEPATRKWDQLKPSGAGPSPRRRQCTVQMGDRLFMFGGTMPDQQKRSLADLSDLFLLDFCPSLGALCSQTIIRHPHLLSSAHSTLPSILAQELRYMSTPNQISKSQTVLRPQMDSIRG